MSDLADDDCLRLAPDAECPAAGSPRCAACVWRPADDADCDPHPGSPCRKRDWVGEPFLPCEVDQ